MEVGQHDEPHVARADAQRAQLRRGLLLGLDVEGDRALKVRMPARQTLEAGVGAGVDENDPVPMREREGVGRQPIAPLGVEHRGQTARPAPAPADELA